MKAERVAEKAGKVAADAKRRLALEVPTAPPVLRFAVALLDALLVAGRARSQPERACVTIIDTTAREVGQRSLR